MKVTSEMDYNNLIYFLFYTVYAPSKIKVLYPFETTISTSLKPRKSVLIDVLVNFLVTLKNCHLHSHAQS